MIKLRWQQRLKGKFIEKFNDQIETFQNIWIKIKTFPKYRDQKRYICQRKMNFTKLESMDHDDEGLVWVRGLRALKSEVNELMDR